MAQNNLRGGVREGVAEFGARRPFPDADSRPKGGKADWSVRDRIKYKNKGMRAIYA